MLCPLQSAIEKIDSVQTRAKQALLLRQSLEDLKALLEEVETLPAYIPEASTINTLVAKVGMAQCADTGCILCHRLRCLGTW